VAHVACHVYRGLAMPLGRGMLWSGVGFCTEDKVGIALATPIAAVEARLF